MYQRDGEEPKHELSTARRTSILLIATILGAVGASGVAGWTAFSRLRTSQVPAARPPSCAELIATMSPRQRFAQLLMVGVDPADQGAATTLARSEGIGGIFLRGSATQLLTGDALAPVTAAATLPIAVSVDEEGGRVQRVDTLDGPIPSARVMAQTMSTGQVRDLARERGRVLRARGVTIDFAPVADVTEQDDDDVIGDRSFGSDPAEVIRYASAFAKGLREAGVLPVVKHFPGHGHADGDSHRSIVSTPPLDELRIRDLLPYRELLQERPIAVMVGHLDVPGMTEGEPASLHPATYRLLRTEYGFDGLTITDDLGAMRAVTQRHPLPDAVLRALDAGADIAFWSTGGQVAPVLDVLEKQLPTARVDAAVARVLHAKSVCWKQ